MPITLPVPGGGGATTPSTYYNGTNLGEYQFISLQEIIENFTAAYVGEGKLLENVLNGDIAFHAHRALQELHYDTVKSCKSQEIEVCSSLKMPLPHDYVNYVKLTWVDNAGIEHIIYPTRNTSNPFAISQADDCSYEFEDGDLKQQQDCVIESLTCSASEIPNLYNDIFGGGLEQDKGPGPESVKKKGSTPSDGDTFWDLPNKAKYNYLENWKSKVDNYCSCTEAMYTKISDRPCGEQTNYDWAIWDCLVGKSIAYTQYEKNGVEANDCVARFKDLVDDYIGVEGTSEAIEKIKEASKDFATVALTSDEIHKEEFYKSLVGTIVVGLFDGSPEDIFGSYLPWDGIYDEVQNGWPEDVTLTSSECNTDSDTWSRYKTGALGTGAVAVNSAATINASVDSDTYMSNYGKRYGLEPEYVQGNGSFYIDCMRGNIHFSSNIAGKTIILKYISDGHGTKDEAIVHKFAEEAMYKWIAYGCLGARVDTPEYVLQRLKKERFAETRKAKIRLSNIKIEEISQVFRGKSKWIKH